MLTGMWGLESERKGAQASGCTRCDMCSVKVTWAKGKVVGSWMGPWPAAGLLGRGRKLP